MEIDKKKKKYAKRLRQCFCLEKHKIAIGKTQFPFLNKLSYLSTISKIGSSAVENAYTCTRGKLESVKTL